MDRISIFNYEAYYLDYLEGNLSEEDTALLMAFFDANPDLRMDEEEILPSFDPEALTLDAAWKNELKQPADDEALSLQNAEYFMIAETEGLLSDKRRSELDVFVDKNPQLKRDRAIFAAVHMTPDAAQVFDNKEELKHKVRALWAYVSFAAAASVAAFFLVWSFMGNGPVAEMEHQMADGSTVNKQGQKDASDDDSENNPAENDSYRMDGQQDQDPLLANVPEETSHQPSNGAIPASDRNNDNRVSVDRMDRRPANTVLTAFEDYPVEPIARKTYAYVEKENATKNGHDGNEDVAANWAMSMYNPIEPITRFVSEKTNTDVDFRTTDKRKSEQDKGFYLKIGKFEISRKKH